MKLFGTDGIRGPANRYPMTSEVAMLVGRALVYTLAHTKDHWGSAGRVKGAKPRVRVVIGKDTRRSGYMIETAIASGVCSMGGEAILLGPLPTPGVAFVATSMRADAGIMISASHNPFADNGIKIFGSDGFKAPDSVEEAIEKLIADPQQMESSAPTGDGVGRAQRIDEAHGRYIVFLKTAFPSNLDLVGMRIALDCANGAAYKAAPQVFEELGAEVVPIGVTPNGVNINLDSGALYPQNLAAKVKEVGAQIGIALDGDADRVIFSDENGEIVDGDQIIGLCAKDMKERGQLKGNHVVATPMSNLGLELALGTIGLKLERAAVGDRFVVERMKALGANIGGENSGHIVFLDHATTGDGILAALRVLSIMRQTGKPLSELKNWVKKTPQVLVNLKVKERKPIESLVTVQKSVKTAEAAMGKLGRVFVRYSGTESLVRILVEGQNADQILGFANDIENAFITDLGRAK